MQLCQTLSAKSMPTMDQDSWYLFSYVKLITTKIAKIETPCLIISLYQFTIFIFSFLFRNFFLFFAMLNSFLLQIIFIVSRLRSWSKSIFSLNLAINVIYFFLLISYSCISVRLFIHLESMIIKI